jgi:hypothetical protein
MAPSVKTATKPGEPDSVRKAYDKQFAADRAANKQPTVVHSRRDLIRRAK